MRAARLYPATRGPRCPWRVEAGSRTSPEATTTRFPVRESKASAPSPFPSPAGCVPSASSSPNTRAARL